MIVLLRHARAGDRDDWFGDDRLRPLDERGREQAQSLVEPLSELGVTRILSSPYVRCVETVEPLAAALRVPVEEADALAEGARREQVLALVAATDAVVLCTHGDVVEELIEAGLKKGAAALLEPTGAGRLQIVGAIPAP